MSAKEYDIPLRREKDELIIGLNVSPYSAYLSSECRVYTEAIKKNAELIQRIVDEFNAGILLIPHVFHNTIRLRMMQHGLNRFILNCRRSIRKKLLYCSRKSVRLAVKEH